MADTNDMVHIAQGEFEQLIGQNGPGIGEPEQRMVSEDSPKSHCPRMKDSFMTEAAHAGVSMHNLNLLANDDVAEYREKGEDGGHCRLAVYDEEWNMVDLEPVGQVPHAGPSFVRMSDDDDLVAAINEFLSGQYWSEHGRCKVSYC